jgi:hypothetical protein
MEGLERYRNQKIKVVFDDCKSVSIKVGYLVSFDNTLLFLRTVYGQEAVALAKVIRIEEVKKS